MGVLRALIVEDLVHDLVSDRKQGAARRVSSGVLAVGACDAAGESSCSVACKNTLASTTQNKSREHTVNALKSCDEGDDGEQSFESHSVGSCRTKAT